MCRNNVFVEFALTPDPYVPLTAPERDKRVRVPGKAAGLLFFSPTFQSSHLTSLPLLLVNHQLHDEFKACLERLSRSKELRYELVVELINEMSMHPTWTLVPTMTKHIPVVHARFLISNEPEGRKGRSEWSSGGMVWEFLSLLVTFAEGGTLLGWNKEGRGWKGTSVDALVFEVKTPEPVRGVVTRTHETRDTPSVFYSAAHVANEISHPLGWIISKDSPRTEYGRKVAACVKKAYLLFDGAEMKRWDVEVITSLGAQVGAS